MSLVEQIGYCKLNLNVIRPPFVPGVSDEYLLNDVAHIYCYARVGLSYKLIDYKVIATNL